MSRSIKKSYYFQVVWSQGQTEKMNWKYLVDRSNIANFYFLIILDLFSLFYYYDFIIQHSIILGYLNKSGVLFFNKKIHIHNIIFIIATSIDFFFKYVSKMNVGKY